jgi:hypothetical protein
MFVLLFVAAIFYRRRPAMHKRLMLLTAVNFLPPALDRIPVASLQALGPLWFFGFPTALALAVPRTRRVPKRSGGQGVRRGNCCSGGLVRREADADANGRVDEPRDLADGFRLMC